jgi:hypothetical protein
MVDHACAVDRRAGAARIAGISASGEASFCPTVAPCGRTWR